MASSCSKFLPSIVKILQRVFKLQSRADADTNTDANCIHPKNNMLPHPSVGRGGGRRGGGGGDIIISLILNIYNSLGKFSRRQIDIFFVFPRKGDNLHEISNPIFWEKQNVPYFCLLNFNPACYAFVCVEVLWPSQPEWVMSSAVNLPNHTFTEQA